MAKPASKPPHPFATPDARRLAALFAVVYFSQGMYHVSDQVVTITLKDDFHLSAGEVATFGWIIGIPWIVKPLYGMLSDSLPLFGLRRKSYFIVMSALASAAALAVSAVGAAQYWPLVALIVVMSIGLAFTDVLTDAMMVENGKPLGLTGAFQSIQWTSINIASILVGVIGGYFAEHRALKLAFAVAALFPLIALVMGAIFIHERPARSTGEEARAAWHGITQAVRDRTMWIVAGFILFFTFSPSIGVPLFYYQTDTLKFSQQYIGLLGSMSAGAAIVGAMLYAPLSRRYPLQRIIVVSIGVAVVGTLAYLLYRGAWSAMIIDTAFGGLAMIVELAFLDLAAKACPSHAEGTFFALLMAVFNLGTQGSQVTGGYLYDWVGYTPLVLISAALTAAAWLLVPLVDIPAIERKAREAGSPPEIDTREATP